MFKDMIEYKNMIGVALENMKGMWFKVCFKSWAWEV